MKRIVLLGLLALCACSKKQDAPPPEPVQTAVPAAVADDWAGKYEGDLRVTIDTANKVMLIEAAPDGCTGDIGLADGGIASGKGDHPNQLTVGLPTEGKGWCEITLTRDGNTIRVSETEECAAYHGATCSFNGTAKRLQ